MLLQNISINLLVNMVYLPRTLESSSALPYEPCSSHCTSYVWDVAWTGLIIAEDDDSSNGSVSSFFFQILCIIINWFQICSRPDSDPSSPSYVSGNSSSTLSAGRPIVGQYLNSDTAPNNRDSTGFQAYQQNVSIILYITT